jgi:hypothetical protein
VKVAPRPLADYSVSDAPGTALSHFGYSFEVPWRATLKQKALGKGLVRIEFESGQNLTFIVPADRAGQFHAHEQSPSYLWRSDEPFALRSVCSVANYHTREYSSVWAASGSCPGDNFTHHHCRIGLCDCSIWHPSKSTHCLEPRLGRSGCVFFGILDLSTVVILKAATTRLLDRLDCDRGGRSGSHGILGRMVEAAKGLLLHREVGA